MKYVKQNHSFFVHGIKTVLNSKFPIPKPLKFLKCSQSRVDTFDFYCICPPYNLFPDTDIELKIINLRILWEYLRLNRREKLWILSLGQKYHYSYKRKSVYFGRVSKFLLYPCLSSPHLSLNQVTGCRQRVYIVRLIFQRNSMFECFKLNK